jgi:hypothetical protein
MFLDFPGANSAPYEEPEDQQWPSWCQVNFFTLRLIKTVAGAPSESFNRELHIRKAFQIIKRR